MRILGAYIAPSRMANADQLDAWVTNWDLRGGEAGMMKRGAEATAEAGRQSGKISSDS